jgi:hypothetical protein
VCACVFKYACISTLYETHEYSRDRHLTMGSKSSRLDRHSKNSARNKYEAQFVLIICFP